MAVAKRREEMREVEKRANLLADNLLRDLTIQEKKDVDAAVLGQGEDTEVIARDGTVTVTKLSMRTLEPKSWLSDEIINFYLKVCLTRRDEDFCQANPGRKRSYCFSSFFLKQLINGKKYSYDNVRAWSQHVPGGDVFNLKYILCPYNIDNVHWAMGAIFMEEKRVKWFDSCGGTEKKVLDGLIQYLKDEYFDKKNREFDVSEWEIVGCTKFVPRQHNGKFEIAKLKCCVGS